MNTVLFGVGTFGSKLLSFLLVRFYTGILPVEDMSKANIIMQVCFLLVPVATLGLEDAVLRFMMKTKAKSDALSPNAVFSTGFFTGMTGIIVIFFAISPVLARVGDTKYYLMPIFCCLFASGLRGINQQAVRAENKIKLFAYDGIQTTLLLVIFSVLLMKTLNWGINGFIFATVFSDIVSSIFLFFASGNYKKLNIFRIDFKLLRIMLNFSVPLIPTYILWWTVSSLDLFMVRYMVGERANGLYSTAYKIPTLISLLSYVFYKAWQMSAITELAPDSETGRYSKMTQNFYTTVFDAYQSILFVSSAGVLFFIKPLTNILTAPEYHSAYIYSPLLVIATILSCYCQFTGGIYTALKQSKRSLYTSIIAAVTCLVFNFALIPIIGAQGAAVSTFLAYGASFAVRAADTIKSIGYSIDGTKFFINMFVLLVMCIVLIFESTFTLGGKSLAPLLLTLGFLAVCMFNLGEMLKTARKFFKRT